MQRKISMLCLAMSMLWQATSAQTVVIPSVIRGVTIMLEYKDFPFDDSVESISDLMNKQGYTANGSIGSVRDYFYTQTNNKVTITSTVVKVSLPENYSFYIANNLNYCDEAIVLLNQIRPEGFQGLTVDPLDGTLLHINFLVRGPGGGSTNGVSKELYLKNNTTELIRVNQGNIFDLGVGTNPTASTICHEMGHSVMSWTDYYRTAFSNLGDFDLMASAGTSKAGQPINPALRLQRGWITNVINISGTANTTYTLTANSYSDIHKYTNPANPKEYLLFHAFKIGGYYQSPMDDGKVLPEGLAIWYVDEDGGFATPGQDAGNQFWIKLVQADNLDEMHDHDIVGLPDIRSDLFDLYGNTNKSFPNGHPFRWKDGGEFGIAITNISNPGTTMSFTVNPRPSTLVSTSDQFGTISPKGTISVANGQSKTFNFIPNIGYELAVVKVNGVVVTNANPYTMTNVNGQQNTISATFKRKTPITPLPTLWKSADIGASPIAGFTSASSGKFSMESYANSSDVSLDNYTYAYQSINGDGTFIAHIAEYNIPTANSKVGLMIRESLDANSAYSAVIKFPFGGAQMEQRTTSGLGMVGNPNNVGNLHMYNWNNWLKIVKSGSLITSYCSRDGVKWNLLGTQTSTLPTQVHVGLCVTGANGTFPSKAVFDNISFVAIPAPTVVITSPLKNAIFTTNSITINASAAAVNTTRNITKVDFYNGITLIGSDNSAPYSIVWSNAPGGIQYITAKVTDNTGAVATSSKISIYLPCSVDPKITGTVIGTLGSWNNYGSTRDKAFDGDVTTYFDASEDIAWTGLSLTIPMKVTGISFYPREGATWRMTGGKFQGSNTADFSSGVVDLATVSTEPLLAWNCYTVSTTSTFKYIRYISPAGGVGNVAEIEFRGTTANLAPVTSITSPVNNSTFVAAASITINANATDSDGSIAKVEFYNGTRLLGTDLTSPYSYNWTGVTAGSYSITTKATDNAGAVTTSAFVRVSVIANKPPLVSITSPSQNTFFNAPATFTLNTSATDNEGPISKVEFYNGSTLLGVDGFYPSFEWSLTNLPIGTYVFTAKAYDGGGLSTISAPITIVVRANTAPTVRISSPLTNTQYAAPATFALYTDAVDNEGPISKVEFYQGTTLLGSDTFYPSFDWYLSNLAAGTYVFKAKAYDAEGLSSFSAPITIVVNPSTTVCLLDEANPTPTQYVVRNDWSDQNSGSTLSTESSALKITHRAYGQNYLWVIKNTNISLVAGKTYTVKFDYKDFAAVPVTGIEVGLSSSILMSGPQLIQPTVIVPAGFSNTAFTTKTVSFTATTTGVAGLSFKLKWASQSSVQITDYIKNLSVCVATSSLREEELVEENTYSTIAADQLVLSPNPTENLLTLEANFDGSVELEVRNATGVPILSQNVTTTKGFQLDVANFVSGLYSILVKSNGKVWKQTFVKQ